jgi:O-antigen/teichoic acid export membrane protein
LNTTTTFICIAGTILAVLNLNLIGPLWGILSSAAAGIVLFSGLFGGRKSWEDRKLPPLIFSFFIAGIFFGITRLLLTPSDHSQGIREILRRLASGS